SSAIDAELSRLYLATGRLAERAELGERQLAERAGYIDPAAASRRAATALERLAQDAAAEPAPLSPVAASLGGASWDDRSATGGLDGGPPRGGASAAAPDGASPGGAHDGARDRAGGAEDDAVPEPIFGPPSMRVGDPSGPAEGTWREADGLTPPGGLVG